MSETQEPYRASQPAGLTGPLSTCKQCGDPVYYNGTYWRHSAQQYRHEAVPVDEPVAPATTWEESMTAEHREIFERLGRFYPTNDRDTVKGSLYDDECGHMVKTYFTARELREMARAFDAAADFLEAK